ncbi:MAG: hypothetical protein C4306_10400 [Thermoleophilia bacterium]
MLVGMALAALPRRRKDRRWGVGLRAGLRGLATFRNWPSLYLRCGLAYAGLARSDLVFRTRTGLVLRAPGDPPEPFPLFGVLALDTYRLGRLRDLAPSGQATVVDVGAHVGSFAVEVARRIPGARVFCYEPNPRACAYLRSNIEDNGMETRISVVPKGVGSRPGRAVLFDAGGESTLVSSLRSDGAPPIEVEVVSFAEAVNDVGPRIDLLKLDCEGSEYALLLETSDTLWTGVERVVLEYHPVAGLGWEDVRRRLGELGFHAVWHDPHGRVADCGVAFFARCQRAGAGE